MDKAHNMTHTYTSLSPSSPPPPPPEKMKNIQEHITSYRANKIDRHVIDVSQNTITSRHKLANKVRVLELQHQHTRACNDTAYPSDLMDPAFSDHPHPAMCPRQQNPAQQQFHKHINTVNCELCTLSYCYQQINSIYSNRTFRYRAYCFKKSINHVIKHTTSSSMRSLAARVQMFPVDCWVSVGVSITAAEKSYITKWDIWDGGPRGNRKQGTSIWRRQNFSWRAHKRKITYTCKSKLWHTLLHWQDFDKIPSSPPPPPPPPPTKRYVTYHLKFKSW